MEQIEREVWDHKRPVEHYCDCSHCGYDYGEREWVVEDRPLTEYATRMANAIRDNEFDQWISKQGN